MTNPFPLTRSQAARFSISPEDVDFQDANFQKQLGFTRSPEFDGSDRLRFGVEIEFVTTRPTEEQVGIRRLPQFSPRTFTAECCYFRLADAIGDCPLPAAYATFLPPDHGIHHLRRLVGDRATLYKDMVIVKGDQVRVNSDRPVAYDFWCVKPDISIFPDKNSDGQEWIGAELATPILTERDAERDCYKIHWALQAMRTAQAGNIKVSRSCGLHVHVSFTSPMKSRHVCRLATLLLVVEEHLLFSLIAGHRCEDECSVEERLSKLSLDKDFQVDQEAIKCITSFSQFKTDTPASLAASKGHLLALLWASWTPRMMADCLTRDITNLDSSAMAFRIHEGPSGDETYTFEFRHAESSFSRSFINNWVTLVLSICKVTTLPPDKFRAAVDGLWRAVLDAKTNGTEERVWEELARNLNQALEGMWDSNIDIEFWRSRLRSRSNRPGGMDVRQDGTVKFT